MSGTFCWIWSGSIDTFMRTAFRALTDLGKAHAYAAFLDQRLVDRLAA